MVQIEKVMNVPDEVNSPPFPMKGSKNLYKNDLVAIFEDCIKTCTKNGYK